MKTSVLFILISLFSLDYTSIDEKIRIINYSGTNYQTTYKVPDSFIGKYKGRRSGYLELRADGTGIYKYDIFGFAPPSCERKPIKFIWGFILDEDEEITKQKRDYGYSYPILMQSTGDNSFQGCRKVVMKDFILQRGEILHVSSSDDWEKVK
ncbi:MAG: hypothetical protein ABFS32_14310 [Bacteroidota bacterium]